MRWNPNKAISTTRTLYASSDEADIENGKDENLLIATGSSQRREQIECHPEGRRFARRSCFDADREWLGRCVHALAFP